MKSFITISLGCSLCLFAVANLQDMVHAIDDDIPGFVEKTVLAQGEVTPWGNVTNLTALGIVAVVMIFIVTKMLPDLHGKFVEQSEVFAGAIEKIQTAFTAILDRMHERDQIREKARHDDQAALATALMTLSAQCARRHAGEEPVDHHA